MDVFQNRRQFLITQMQKQGLNALILTPSADFLYLTGLNKKPAQRITALILTASCTFLLTPIFEQENIAGKLSDIRPVFYKDGQDVLSVLCSLLSARGQSIAIGKEMQAQLLLAIQKKRPDLYFVNADLLLAPMRLKKSADEIAILETAQAMAENSLTKLLKNSLIGRSESQISRQLMQLRLEEGFDSVGEGIIASGENTASAHHINSHRIIRSGDVVMFDIGGTYMGYHADFTRTFVIDKAPAEFENIYSVVLEAFFAGQHAAVVGNTASSVDRAARDVIDKAGYANYFPHRLGHGIGLDGHEPPFISSDSQLPLESGNVFSCEPGIYLPGRFGVRIEDLLVLEETGARSINTLSKTLQIL